MGYSGGNMINYVGTDRLEVKREYYDGNLMIIKQGKGCVGDNTAFFSTK